MSDLIRRFIRWISPRDVVQPFNNNPWTFLKREIVNDIARIKGIRDSYKYTLSELYNIMASELFKENPKFMRWDELKELAVIYGIDPKNLSREQILDSINMQINKNPYSDLNLTTLRNLCRARNIIFSNNMSKEQLETLLLTRLLNINPGSMQLVDLQDLARYKNIEIDVNTTFEKLQFQVSTQSAFQNPFIELTDDELRNSGTYYFSDEHLVFPSNIPADRAQMIGRITNTFLRMNPNVMAWTELEILGVLKGILNIEKLSRKELIKQIQEVDNVTPDIQKEKIDDNRNIQIGNVTTTCGGSTFSPSLNAPITYPDITYPNITYPDNTQRRDRTTQYDLGTEPKRVNYADIPYSPIKIIMK